VRGELPDDRIRVAAANVSVLPDVLRGDEEVAGSAEFLRLLHGLAVPGRCAGRIRREVQVRLLSRPLARLLSADRPGWSDARRAPLVIRLG
jgi:hypothetical protein